MRHRDTRTVYYNRPGENFRSTSSSKRPLALIATPHAFDRFSDYTTESHKVALYAEREAKRLAALKEAGQEMRKAQGIGRYAVKREPEWIKKNAETEEFLREAKERQDQEHAEIVAQARELLLKNVPQCRAIDRALKVSECLRELEEQIKFQEEIKNIYKHVDDKFVEAMNEDVKKFFEEEKQRKEAAWKKVLDRRAELEKIIGENKKKNDAIKKATMQEEVEELEFLRKEAEETKRQEQEQSEKKREELKKMFLEAIEKRQQYLAKMKEEDELGQRYLNKYNTLKKDIEKETKDKNHKFRMERNEMAEKLVKKFKKKSGPTREELEEEIYKKVVAQREQEELEKDAEKQAKKEKMRQEIIDYQKSYEKEKAIREKEEMDLKLWEILQREKRNEFNKAFFEGPGAEENKKKAEYAKLLKIQMAYNEEQKQKQAAEENKIDDIHNKEMYDKCNARILAYAENVMEESKGVRPLFPIAKAIKTARKDLGLDRPDKEKMYDQPERRPFRRGKKMACNRPVKEEDQFFFA